MLWVLFDLGRRGIMAITTGGTEERFTRGNAYGDINDVLYWRAITTTRVSVHQQTINLRIVAL